MEKVLEDLSQIRSLAFLLSKERAKEDEKKETEYCRIKDAAEVILMKLDALKNGFDGSDIVERVGNTIWEMKSELEKADKMGRELRDSCERIQGELRDREGQIERLQKKRDEENEIAQDLRKESEIRKEYVRDLEKQLEEAFKSNRYYEDQLIKADEVIKEFRDNRVKIDLSAEMNKIKKAHMKENALLRIRIEELEFQLESKAKSEE